MNIDEVMLELKNCGNESTKKTLIKHGAKAPFFGVKVEDLKKIQKKTKTNHKLALELFATGNSDAMYELGDIYYYGENVEQDYGKALEWFQKAANQGYERAR